MLKRNDIRGTLDKMVEEVIYNNCSQDSLLADILMSKSPSSRRSIILGGMMRMARQDDFKDRACVAYRGVK